MPQTRMLREQPLAAGMLNPKPGGRDRELLAGRQVIAMGNRKKGNAVKIYAANSRIGLEENVEQKMASFMRAESNRAAGKEQPNRRSSLRT